jgi:SAM-dependent methyltransferase
MCQAFMNLSLVNTVEKARSLNLGCGSDIRPSSERMTWVNLDIAALPGVGVVHDIEQAPWPLEDASFDHVRCEMILEHMEYVPVIREIHRILKPGGSVFIVVPHFTSRNNFIDPTHKKLFSIRTFEFFTKNNAYGRDYYFDFHFSRIARRRITLEHRIVLFYNYLIEPIINLSLSAQIVYEATLLSRLFPAEDIKVELVK